MYQVIFEKNFNKKYFEKIPKDYQEKIKLFIENRLAPHPHESGKPLKGDLDEKWSARVGVYRILYKICKSKIVIFIIKIEHRKDVYG